MKRLYKITGALLLSSLAIAGCTDNNSSNGDSKSNSSQSQTTKETAPKDTKAVSEAVNAYYTFLTSKQDEFTKAGNKVEDAITKSTDAKTYKAFATSDNPMEDINKLDDTKAKTLADNLQKINPIADQFDYSGLKDQDRALLNLINIASGVVYSDPSGDKNEIKITIPEDSIKFDGTTATVPYSDMKIVLNDKEQDMNTDSFGSDTITLNYVDGKWKINGKKALESIEASMPKTTSDGGTD